MLNWLGIKPSYSRPRVSDDNPYAEALFRTAKYRPEFPVKGFADLHTARQWAVHFVQWVTTNTATAASATSPGPASCRAGWSSARRSPRALPGRALTQPATLEQADPQLETSRRRHPQSERDVIIRAATSQICFPVRSASLLSVAWQRPSRGAQRRRWEEQGHPQPRAACPVAREHGEDGEHRTFSWR